MLSSDVLKQAFPRCGTPDVWANALQSALPKFGIDTPNRIASFLAQTGYESGQFNHLEENLHYTAARLTKVWSRRFPDLAAAAPYANNPQKLADFVYSNRMGNGNVESDDGFRFRGRGIIQLTGRSNYAAAGKAIGADLITHPELLSKPEYACLSAAWFGHGRGLNELADDRTDDNDLEDFTEITRRINGGKTGIKERFALFKQVFAVLN